MEDFNVTGWFRKQYLIEGGENITQANELAQLINNAIISIDDSMSYKDFAQSVAFVLKENYGSHNINPFMEVLHAELGINESLNEEAGISDMESEFSNKFGVRASSNFYSPYNTGHITIHTRGDIDDIGFESMIKFIEDKGYTVDRDQSQSDFDEDPGERLYYPRIKFNK